MLFASKPGPVKTLSLDMPSSQDKSSVKSLAKEPENDEKDAGVATMTTYEESDVDEAMMLVGAERSAVFSEEYNAKLRRKLVS